MAEQFDAYHKWLGISPEKQPPNLYQLLAVDDFESDPDVIEAAADQRMSHLRKYQTGKRAKLSQKLLNEISAAQVTLLNPDKKTAYDEQLRQQLDATADDPLGSSFDQLGGGTTLGGPAGVLPQPSAPAISLDKAHKKPSWILPVGISVAAIAILAVVVAVIVLNGSKKDKQSTQDPVAKQEDAPAAIPPKPTPSGQQTVDDDETPRDESPSSLDETETASANVPPADEADNAGVDSTSDLGADDLDTVVAGPDGTVDLEPRPPLEPVVASAEEASEPESPAVKDPLPTDAEQQPVWATLEETFKLSESRTSEQQLKLAGDLFQLAGQSVDPVERFVLLRATMKYAGEGGDAQLLINAVDAIDRSFEIDPLDIAQKALIGFAGLATSDKHFETLAGATRQVIADAVAQDRIDLAQTLAQQIYDAALKRASATYRKQFFEQRNRMDQLFAQRKTIHDAQAKLQSDPDDPEANLIVGKWKCFERGDWESGLPLLAKSGDETLAKLAEQELSLSGENVDDQLALGEAWRTAAEKAGPAEKDDYLGRAYNWYVLAQPNITAPLDKLRIEKRLEEIGDLARPTPPRPTPPPSRQVRRGLKLDGKSFIQTNLVYTGSSPITIEAVVVPSLASHHQTLLSNLDKKGLGIELYRGRWQLTFHDSRGIQDARATQPVEINKRVVIAGVFDGRTIKLFLNGELQSTTAVVGHKPSPLRFQFGADPGGRDEPQRLFVGVIEAVRVSDEALYSESYEPAEEFERTKSTILLLKLDKGEGAVAHDSSVHKNHCQIVGAEWITLDEIPSN